MLHVGEQDRIREFMEENFRLTKTVLHFKKTSFAQTRFVGMIDPVHRQADVDLIM
jgi:hypothetical protein